MIPGTCHSKFDRCLKTAVGLLLLSGLFHGPRAVAGVIEESGFSSRQLRSVYAMPRPDGGTYGLLLYFHGTGGAASYKSVPGTLVSVARKHRLWPVSIRAPDGFNWPSQSWESRNGFAEYVDDLLRKRLLRLPWVDSRRIFFMGWSAGAIFLSGDFLPHFGAGYRGAALMFCGGGMPFLPAVYKVEDLKKNMVLYYRIGQKDFLFRQTMPAVKFYRRFGVRVLVRVGQEAGHCNFDMAKELKEGLAKIR